MLFPAIRDALPVDPFNVNACAAAPAIVIVERCDEKLMLFPATRLTLMLVAFRLNPGEGSTVPALMDTT